MLLFFKNFSTLNSFSEILLVQIGHRYTFLLTNSSKVLLKEFPHLHFHNNDLLYPLY